MRILSCGPLLVNNLILFLVALFNLIMDFIIVLILKNYSVTTASVMILSFFTVCILILGAQFVFGRYIVKEKILGKNLSLIQNIFQLFLMTNTTLRVFLIGSHNIEQNLKLYSSNEVFLNPTPLPSYIPGMFTISAQNQLMLLNGSIALISMFNDTFRFQILILGELGVEESWTKIFMVGPWPLPWCHWPIGVAKKGGMLFLKQDPDQRYDPIGWYALPHLVWFDLNTQMIRDLGIIFKNSCFFNILFHQENFITFEGKHI